MKIRPTLILITLVCAAMVSRFGITSAAGQIWTPTGSMSTPHVFHTATLLPSGKVLVAAGNGFASGFEFSTELYDPATETWTPTGTPLIERKQHTATLLASGKVLMTGGLWGYGVLNT